MYRKCIAELGVMMMTTFLGSCFLQVSCVWRLGVMMTICCNTNLRIKGFSENQQISGGKHLGCVHPPTRCSHIIWGVHHGECTWLVVPQEAGSRKQNLVGFD
ncbi:PREDICTED: uncharacterized protein LOC104588120 [Nelumbo nucifera]|uniref:Uncharacterized protein LOC104588120 n=1 Tax=Nelumbo nucifera TaxID=4432 RepID=A0A1U7YUZ1_NELNU|nr:PREDICTED: uncharacterized protein LOC104588120 [Nelumbo nucifera]